MKQICECVDVCLIYMTMLYRELFANLQGTYEWESSLRVMLI